MKLEAFVPIFLCIILDSCFAAECPARAIFAPTLEVDEGYECVCRSNFYGNRCQYKAQNRSALEVDAQWRNNSTATAIWKSTYGREFYLTVRRATFGPKGTTIFGKWRKAAVNFITIAMETSEVGWVTEGATFTAQLGLMKDLSYEIRLVEMWSDGGNLTASVFLDAQELAVDDESNLNNAKNEEESCTWYACPARFFGEILKNFGTSCFVHGAIFAVLVTVIGTILLGSVLYIVIRQCKKQHHKENIDQLEVNLAEEPKTNVSSGAKLQDVCSKSSNAVCGKTKKISVSRTSIGMEDEPNYVVIDMPEILVTAPSKSSIIAVLDRTEQSCVEPKSAVIAIPEIMVTAPVSEAGSQSESSADESSSEEGEYILP